MSPRGHVQNGVVLDFSSLHISSSPSLIPQGLLFVSELNWLVTGFEFSDLLRGRVNVRGREAAEKELSQQQGAVGWLQTISLASTEENGIMHLSR